jgi:hypothetical protein
MSGGLDLLWGRVHWSDQLNFFSTLLKFGILSSLLESLWVLSTLVLSITSCCIPLHSTMTYTQDGNKTLTNKLELVNLILLFAAFHLCQSLRVSTSSRLEQLCFELVTMDFFVLYNQDSSSFSCHLELCDSS